MHETCTFRQICMQLHWYFSDDSVSDLCQTRHKKSRRKTDGLGLYSSTTDTNQNGVNVQGPPSISVHFARLTYVFLVIYFPFGHLAGLKLMPPKIFLF